MVPVPEKEPNFHNEPLSSQNYMTITNEVGTTLTTENGHTSDALSSAVNRDVKEFDVGTQAKLLLNISVPSVAAQIGYAFLFPQTASAIGRLLGKEELAGFSLASLSGNFTCLSIIVGTLSASETLQPRAYGCKDYPEVGRLAIRGFAATTLVLVLPVFVLLNSADSILRVLGQDPTASSLAKEWINFYLIGIPSCQILRIIQRFLSCQNIVWPVAGASLLGCFILHPLLLAWLVPRYGFLGSAVAVASSQTTQLLLLLTYLLWAKPYHPKTWPGLSISSIRESVRLGPLLSYLKLGLGGVFAFSEWWFWESVCFTAGRLGVVPLCAHTIAYQIVPTLFMIALGLSIGLNVRIGTVLANDVKTAKRITFWTLCFTFIIASTVSLCLYLSRVAIINLFTNDPNVVEASLRIWPKLVTHTFLVYFFAVNAGILKALGMQWRLAVAIVVVLWFGTLPIIIKLAINDGGGLDMMWTIIPAGYLILDIVLTILFVTADWHAISRQIREKNRRRIGEGMVPDSQSPLLGKSLSSGNYAQDVL